MAYRRGTVSVLPDRGWGSQVQREQGDALRAVAGHLDELCDCLQGFSPRRGWPAKQWMIASTALRMRLPSANQGLSDLTGLISAGEQRSIRWVFQLNDVCRTAREQLHDIETSLEPLLDPGASSAERARGANLFATIQSGLLPTLAEIHCLLIQQITDVDVGDDERLAAARDSEGHAAANGQAATEQTAGRKLAGELHRLDERLRAMLDVYEEEPSAIDAGFLSDTDRAMDVGTAIGDTYRIMKTRVYAEDSPLRADRNAWAAFEEQKGEFIEFYKSAVSAVEIYREVMRAFRRTKMTAEPLSRRGDLKSVQEDKHVQVAERAVCIEAISDFQGKVSAMLTSLR